MKSTQKATRVKITRQWKYKTKNTRCQYYVHRYKDNYVIKLTELFQHPLAMIQWHCQTTMHWKENEGFSVMIRSSGNHFALLHFSSVKLVLRELCSNIKAHWKGQTNKLYGSTAQPLALYKSAPMKITAINLRSRTSSFILSNAFCNFATTKVQTIFNAVLQFYCGSESYYTDLQGSFLLSWSMGGSRDRDCVAPAGIIGACMCLIFTENSRLLVPLYKLHLISQFV